MSSTTDSEIPDTSDEGSTVFSEDVVDEQMFFILKRFLVSKSGKNIADCIEDLGDKIERLIALSAKN